jgi:hypothetical protein
MGIEPTSEAWEGCRRTRLFQAATGRQNQSEQTDFKPSYEGHP